MTNKERAESRAICKAATEGPWEYKDNGFDGWIMGADRSMITGGESHEGRLEGDDPNVVFIAHARTALPKALDALEEAIAEYGTAIEIIAERTADRDLWKARAVALERAMKELAGCEGCVHEQVNYYAEPCKSCKDSRSDWQFDQERFMRAESEGTDG